MLAIYLWLISRIRFGIADVLPSLTAILVAGKIISQLVEDFEIVIYIHSGIFKFQHSIRSTVQRKGLKKLWHKLFGPPKIAVTLIEERDLMFALALVS